MNTAPTTQTTEASFPARVNAGVRALIAHRGGWDLSDRIDAEDVDYKLYEIGVSDPEELDAIRAEVRAVLTAAEGAGR